MIKIITGHSEQGGSTELLIRLTNLFNENGYDCTMYGPHDWFLDKCKGDRVENVKFPKKSNDIIISHIVEHEERPRDVKKVIYYCHEKWWWKRLDEINQVWDHVVFSHEEHRQWHSYYQGPYSCIPNPKDESLLYRDKSHLDKVAGIIGSVEERKQTHVSIENALNDGCEKIYVFGVIRENEKYYGSQVKKYRYHPNVEFVDHMNNKQEMYDMIGRVYHYSMGEVACLVKDESYQTGTKFFGSGETTHEVSKLTNLELLEVWKKLLDL
jgi:glycosyltransferase involved in cell wall biosynthesis